MLENGSALKACHVFPSSRESHRPAPRGAFGERHVDPAVALIETKEDKIMLTRNNELLQLGGKFPRLMKKQPKARLNEIKRLLLAM